MADALTDADRQGFARARERGREQLLSETAVVAARYDSQRDAFEVVFRGGKTLAIPRTLVPELVGVPVPLLERVSVSPAGDAICWRSLDVDIDLRGLVERAGLKI